MEYLDFEVQIDPVGGRDYTLNVRSPAGEVRETMRFPLDELALENRLKDVQIALLRSGAKQRRVGSPEEQAVQRFGLQMFNALFTGEARSLYDVSRQKAATRSAGLRLKLSINAPELAILPWEYIYDPREGEYICLSTSTPLVRYLQWAQTRQPLTVKPPLRILAMIASPSDLMKLDTEQERARLETAIHELQVSGRVELTWLKGQSWRDLQREMRAGSQWHIFHFIGHGGFDHISEEGFIALVDDNGQMFPIGAAQLGRLLDDHKATAGDIEFMRRGTRQRA
jgi:hypothetical protein